MIGKQITETSNKVLTVLELTMPDLYVEEKLILKRAFHQTHLSARDLKTNLCHGK